MFACAIIDLVPDEFETVRPAATCKDAIEAGMLRQEAAADPQRLWREPPSKLEENGKTLAPGRRKTGEVVPVRHPVNLAAMRETIIG